MGTAPNDDLMFHRFQNQDISRAGNDTLVAGGTFIGIYNRKTVTIHNDGIKGTNLRAC